MSQVHARKFALAVGLTVLLTASSTARAADESAKPAAYAADLEKAVGRAVEFLSTTGQAPDGSFNAAAGPGITALVTTGVLRTGRTADDPLVARSLKYLQTFVQPDGAISKPDSKYRNYETCLAIMCFKAANRDGRYDALLAAADKFVKELQWDDGEAHDRSSNSFGGAGYGGHKRPDLSNTSFMIDALHALGSGPDDPAIQKALVFVSRCQNLESTYNTTEFAAKNPDGGFYYTPAAGGSSQAGTTPEGGLRSYASMTYAGLKSMIYAGLGPDDPRVKAAVAWIGQHYDLASNPGMGDAGLFYYYNTFAKALEAMHTDRFVDAKKVEHDWRAELVAELVRRQRPDGSWINENSRWLEGDPSLVTGYALMALGHCRPAASR